MSDLSRLSDMNIEDDVLRAHYYKRVMDYVNQAGNADLLEYTIRLDETYRADLASYRLFAAADLEWLVYLVCDIEDSSEPLPVGETIRLPSASWIRSSMRQFMDEMGLTHA